MIVWNHEFTTNKSLASGNYLIPNYLIIHHDRVTEVNARYARVYHTRINAQFSHIQPMQKRFIRWKRLNF